ncbi:MAG: hypothetical protein EVB11_04680 [Winogradskyella sp.]|nr:MAG: hypothetical protein EVB11_04680 [Winogradskyella sp.]
MRTYRIILLLFLITLNSFYSEAQNDSKALSEMAKKMFESTNDRDFDTLLDMTYPKVYEIVPKETMKTMFVSMFEGTDEMSIDLPKLTPEYELSDMFSDEETNTDYAFLTYDMSMSMTFKKEGFDEEGQGMMIKMFKVQGMDAEFETDKKVNIKAPNRMVIFLKNETSGGKWTMINYDTNSPIFYQILSSNVLETSKSYYENIMIEAKKKN